MANSGETNGGPGFLQVLVPLGVTDFHPGPLPSQCFPREWVNGMNGECLGPSHP